MTPDGSNAYVTNKGVSSDVSVIDTATNTVTATIPIGAAPGGVAVTPDGSKAYVANESDNIVSVIATATNTVTATITVDAFSNGVAVSPDGSTVYITNVLPPSDVGTVSVIDTATNRVSATIPVGASPLGVAVTPDGSKVYVANQASGTVSVIDTATNAGVVTIPVGADPFGVAVTPDGSKVYVANESSNTVSVIATATNTVTATIPVGRNPEAFGIFIQPLSPLSPSQVATTASGLAYSRVSRTFNGTVTITNISSSAISGPLQILFTGLPAGVTLANATAEFSGSPYLTITVASAAPGGAASLAPGQSVTASVQFGNPSFAAINFTPVLYSGNI